MQAPYAGPGPYAGPSLMQALTPRIIATAVTPRLWPRVALCLAKVSAPFWVCPKRPPGTNSAASIAHNCLSKAVPTAQTDRQPLTWLVPNASLNSKRSAGPYLNPAVRGSRAGCIGQEDAHRGSPERVGYRYRYRRRPGRVSGLSYCDQ
jgi:hypothetical protein